MPESLTSTANTINLLINAGVAGVFAIFALAMLKEFIRYLSKRDEQMIALTKTIAELTTVTSLMKEDLVEHSKAAARYYRDLKQASPSRGGYDAGKTS